MLIFKNIEPESLMISFFINDIAVVLYGFHDNLYRCCHYTHIINRHTHTHTIDRHRHDHDNVLP